MLKKWINNTQRKKIWRKTDSGRLSDKTSRLKHLYKITKYEYESLLKLQDNKCYLCKEDKKLHIDHCHITNKVRKLLCEKCNRQLGYYEIVRQDIELYEKYIKEHEIA